jgi:predicted nucleotidyltransferase
VVNSYCKEIKDYVINNLRNIDFDVEIYIFGSVAKETCNVNSDLDILIKFKSFDIGDIHNSVFYNKNPIIETKVKTLISSKLGLNPITKSKFDIQLVGAYELRFFPKHEIEQILGNAIMVIGNKKHPPAYTKW